MHIPQDGSTALTLACDSGAAEIVDSLLQYGADVNAQKKVCTICY